MSRPRQPPRQGRRRKRKYHQPEAVAGNLLLVPPRQARAIQSATSSLKAPRQRLCRLRPPPRRRIHAARASQHRKRRLRHRNMPDSFPMRKRARVILSSQMAGEGAAVSFGQAQARGREVARGKLPAPTARAQQRWLRARRKIQGKKGLRLRIPRFCG